MDIFNKVIVITGASDGIGKEVALKLSKHEVKLALIGRDRKRLDKVLEDVHMIGSPDSKRYICDIRDKSQISGVINNISSDFGGVDILINNAGIWHVQAQLDEIRDSSIENVIDTNLRGLVFFTQKALPLLRRSEEAAILNISSRSGYVAKEGQSVYAATKWAVRGFTEVLKADLKKSNIRVAGIYQGGTKTKIFEKAGDELDISEYTDPKDLADVIAFMLTRPPKIWLSDVRVEC